MIRKKRLKRPKKKLSKNQLIYFETTLMRMIVGLGNPGEQYRETLHNVGFMAVDRLADQLSISSWSEKFSGLIATGKYKSESFVLLKPLTFMNNSGRSVQACLHFYKISLSDVLVLSDDVDLTPGKLRYRTQGGHGGHNGLRNIIDLCGGNNFQRLRIGIGRPDKGKNTANYVLKKADSAVNILLQEALSEVPGYLQDFILEGKIQVRN